MWKHSTPDSLPPVVKSGELWTWQWTNSGVKPGKLQKLRRENQFLFFLFFLLKQVCPHTCRFLSDYAARCFFSSTRCYVYSIREYFCCALLLPVPLQQRSARLLYTPLQSALSHPILLLSLYYTSCFSSPLTYSIPPHSCISPPETQEDIPSKQWVPPRGLVCYKAKRGHTWCVVKCSV